MARNTLWSRESATLKSDAENVVKHVEGVERVDNPIKVLPLSPNDDRIRREEFRSIYGFPALNKYAWESVQSIPIIVDSGTLPLEGSVRATRTWLSFRGVARTRFCLLSFHFKCLRQP